MKRNTILTVLGVALIGYFFWHSSAHTPSLLQKARSAQFMNSAHAAQPAGLSSAPSSGKSSPELNSLQDMTNLFAKFAKNEADLEALIQHFESTGQSPIVARDVNDYTGEMDVVHTNNPEVGTRYFLGQFFVDEAGKRFAQHLSFEFKPGPTAMQDVTEALRSSFPGLAQPSYQNGANFIQWDVGNGYVVWVKRLTQEDIDERDPENVYTQSDIGTIKTALEINPHDGED